MNPALSIYLDALRFCAAFMVFLSHYSTKGFSGGVLWQLQPYGRTSVLVFFVLSGVIIAYVTERLETTLKDYAIARMARIYSVVLPALLITAALDFLAAPAAPGLADTVLGFAASALFLGSSWNLTLHPGADLPFWSLNYEVWYYVLFGIATFFRGRARTALITISALIAGPKILLLFPIWLMGAAVWRYRARVPERLGPFLMVGAVATFGAIESAGGHDRFWYAETPWLADHFSVYDYIAGALVAVFILGLARTRLPMPGPRAAKALKALAGTSFGLYLLHDPLLRFFSDVLPHQERGYKVALFVLALGLSIGIARSIEGTKAVYKKLLYRISPATTRDEIAGAG